MVRLSLDASNVQREKLVFELVEPYIPGFSVEPMEVDDEATTAAVEKRKTDDETKTQETKSKSKKNKKSKK